MSFVGGFILVVSGAAIFALILTLFAVYNTHTSRREIAAFSRQRRQAARPSSASPFLSTVTLWMKTFSALMAPTVRFDIFEANLLTGELRRGGVPVRLPPQPFKVLALQREASQAIARQIVATTLGAGRVGRQPALIDPEAYRAYLKGRFFWNKRLRGRLSLRGGLRRTSGGTRRRWTGSSASPWNARRTSCS